MTETTTELETDAQAYQHLADRIRDAEQSEVWAAIGKEMSELANPTDHADGEFVGYTIAVSESRVGNGAELADIISPGHRQFGGSRSGLLGNAVAENAAVYAVREQSVNNPVEAARDAIVDALERAADAA